MATTVNKIAIIDIGSNSVRLKIFSDGKILLKKRAVPRLGAGIFQTQKLSNESIESSIKVIKEYYQIAQENNAPAYAFATAAVRTALNRQDFVDKVKDAVGIDIDVISGELEAQIDIIGALGEYEDGSIIDIGGNSTEVSVRENGEIVYSKSISIGAVKLKDICGEDEEKLTKTVNDYIKEFDNLTLKNVHLIGGSGTCFGSLVKGENADGFVLTKEALEKQIKILQPLTIEQRKELKGMEKTKADVIVGGGILLMQLYRKFQLNEVIVCESDNLEGYATYILQKLRKCYE